MRSTGESCKPGLVLSSVSIARTVILYLLQTERVTTHNSENETEGKIVKVVIGSDHAGYDLKVIVLQHLKGLGFEMLDVGTDSTAPVDYPDFALRVGQAVRDGAAERGVLICGSGIGASVAANKIDGIRAGLAHDHYSAHQGVEHDDMNVIVFGSRVIGEAEAKELAEAFLGAQFTHEERHMRRLAKLQKIEETHGL